MASGEIRVGDVASRFIIILEDNGDIVDLSGSSLLQVIFHKPDATIVTKTGTLYTDGTDGKLFYATTSTGDLDQEGIWKLQIYLEFNTGGKFHSDITTFQVYPNLS